MSKWSETSVNNLLPLSRSSVFVEALREWFYTGRNEDYEKPIEACQLCEHEDLRYHFHIKNQHTGGELWVGSRCILRFEIPAIDREGRFLDAMESKKKVLSDQRKLVRSAERKAVRRLLVELRQADQEFRISSFIDYYDTRGAFTPKQLSLIIWRLRENDVHGKGFGLKMTIRRDHEKDQLLAMKEWQIQQLWPYMSKHQQQWYKEETEKMR